MTGEPLETSPRYRLVVAEGEYTADTLWELMAEVVLHRWSHWRRGEGWRD